MHRRGIFYAYPPLKQKTEKKRRYIAFRFRSTLVVALLRAREWHDVVTRKPSRDVLVNAVAAGPECLACFLEAFVTTNLNPRTTDIQGPRSVVARLGSRYRTHRDWNVGKYQRLVFLQSLRTAEQKNDEVPFSGLFEENPDGCRQNKVPGYKGR